MALDRPLWLRVESNMPPRGPEIAPRRLQMATALPKEAPKRHTSFKHVLLRNVVCPLADSPRMGSEALRWPRRIPEGPQDGHNGAQERPERGERFSDSDWGFNTEYPPLLDRWPPKWPHEEYCPNKALRAPQEELNRVQKASKIVPGSLQ